MVLPVSVLADRFPSPSRPLLRTTALVLVGTLLIAASAHVRVPMWPVPITMQSFAVLLIGLTYRPLIGVLTVATYLAEGLLGLPVFTGGPSTLLGPTGGYLVGFLPATMLVGWLAQHGWSRSVGRILVSMLSGTLVIYAFGATWLATFVGAEKAIELGVLPSLFGDALKAALAGALVPALWRATSPR